MSQVQTPDTLLEELKGIASTTKAGQTPPPEVMDELVKLAKSTAGSEVPAAKPPFWLRLVRSLHRRLLRLLGCSTS